jgi:hypothetical protein
MKLHPLAMDSRAINSFNNLKDRFTFVHGYKYDYSQVVYRRGIDKITIICPTHGHFEQTSKDHLSGRGCYQCGQDSTHKKQTKSTKKFITESIKVHGNKYDYVDTVYTGAHTKLNIICKTHGVFTQSPRHHLFGKGCPDCAEYGFDKKKPAILYYLKIQVSGINYYKIGITNRTVKERYKVTDRAIFQILHQIHYKVGETALAEETKLKRQFKEYQYKGPDILSSGNSELFTEDIMKLYYKG